MHIILMTFLTITFLSANQSFATCSPIFDLPADGSLDDLAETTDVLNANLVETGTEESDAPEVTKRVELFRFEKDYNPKNVLHYGVKINTPSCTISYKENGAPNFSNFWKMGEERGQTEGMTADDLKRLGPIILAHDEHQVVFKMAAMDQVEINKKSITIEAKIVDGDCRVTASAQLNDGRSIVIEKFYAELSTVLGVPTGISSLRVDGRDPHSGQSISQQL
ncbi:MAG: hypothetical protein A2X86_10500 [Bdellovibrionales bacterium GWA2_49_15]|nr:MAG: hypothetical protein A2X86_10500 [Bdellovibrionales bacterium GWA2_49_15]